MTLQAVAHLLRRECDLPVVAGAIRLSFIIGFHGQVRRGSNLGLKRLVLTVAVQALLTLVNMHLVIECHLPWTRVSLLILCLLLERKRRWDFGLCLGETASRCHRSEEHTSELQSPLNLV